MAAKVWLSVGSNHNALREIPKIPPIKKSSDGMAG
jgi:hypothetical protein